MSYNNQTDPRHQQYHQEHYQDRLNYNESNGDSNYLNYKMALDSKANTSSSEVFNGLFESPGSGPTSNHSLPAQPSSSQQQQQSPASSSLHHHQQQANNQTFDDSNLSGSSTDRLQFSTSNITNPALSSFFQLPFELQIQQFPLTNPPLFDFQQSYYTPPVLLPNDSHLVSNNEPFGDVQNQTFPNQGVYGTSQAQQLLHLNQPALFHGPPNGAQPTLRRRISISNGQIGQLVQFTQQQIQFLNPSYSPEAVLAATAALIQQNPALNNVQPHSLPQAISSSHNSPSDKQQLPIQQSKIKQIPIPPQQQPAPPQVDDVPQEDIESPGSNHPSGLTTNANGVPQHRLIYNNEVIFNPNNGPIPGTSAWKKQKLLERNRIAASKCRQRKKQQQQRLEQDIGKYVRDNKNLALKLKIMETKLVKFSKVMELHFQKCHSGDNSFPLLKELINDTEEELAKVKLEDNDDGEFDVEDEDPEESDFLDSSSDKRKTGEASQFDFPNVSMVLP